MYFFQMRILCVEENGKYLCALVPLVGLKNKRCMAYIWWKEYLLLKLLVNFINDKCTRIFMQVFFNKGRHQNKNGKTFAYADIRCHLAL